MRLLQQRIGAAQRARQAPYHGVDYHQRRILPTRQHVVANRHLVVDKRLADALIEALVVPAQQDQTLLRHQLIDHRLAQNAPLRGQQHHAPPGRGHRPHAFNRSSERLRLHNHARPAAVRVVIDHLVPVRSPVADVMHMRLSHPGRKRTPKDRCRQRAIEHIREQREHIDAHRS